VTDNSASLRPAGPADIRLITISAAYGAGGSVVAPALAERLGIPFIDRATGRPADLVARSNQGERLSAEEAGTTPVHRLLGSLSHVMPAGPTLSPPSHFQHDDEIRHVAEQDVMALAASGGGVVLGRAAAIVLGRDRGFHVRLDGPPHLRLAQGAVVEGVSIDEAKAHTTPIWGGPGGRMPLPPGHRQHRYPAGHRCRSHPGFVSCIYRPRGAVAVTTTQPGLSGLGVRKPKSLGRTPVRPAPEAPGKLTAGY
jgi:hypothetical protein